LPPVFFSSMYDGIVWPAVILSAVDASGNDWLTNDAA
jgi:hypothetical protein